MFHQLEKGKNDIEKQHWKQTVMMWSTGIGCLSISHRDVSMGKKKAMKGGLRQAIRTSGANSASRVPWKPPFAEFSSFGRRNERKCQGMIRNWRRAKTNRDAMKSGGTWKDIVLRRKVGGIQRGIENVTKS
jgi:hypothetical protein